MKYLLLITVAVAASFSAAQGQLVRQPNITLALPVTLPAATGYKKSVILNEAKKLCLASGCARANKSEMFRFAQNDNWEKSAFSTPSKIRSRYSVQSIFETTSRDASFCST